MYDKNNNGDDIIIKDEQIIFMELQIKYCFNAFYYSICAAVGNDAMIKHFGINDTLD